MQGLFQTLIWFNSQKIKVIHSKRIIKKKNIVTRDIENIFDRTPMKTGENGTERHNTTKDIPKKVIRTTGHSNSKKKNESRF